MTYPAWNVDAQVPRTSVKVDADGNAACSRRDPNGVLWTGQVPATDSAITDLLRRPGLVRDLATPCPLQIKDAGPYVESHFASDDAVTVHYRLVRGSCSTADLDEMVQTLEQIGDRCIATAVLRPDVPDGSVRAVEPMDGGPQDVPVDGTPLSDGAADARRTIDAAPDGQVDAAVDGPVSAVDASAAGCVRPLAEFSMYCPASYDDVLASRATCLSYETIDLGECVSDHTLMFRRAFGTHTATCFYDPESHDLVGATFSNDVSVCEDGNTLSSSKVPFCQPACGDGCNLGGDARFVSLTRYFDCCRRWAYPIPGCPIDGGID